MDRKEGIKLCICRSCPTYIFCKEEIAYCLTAEVKNTCITEEAGCLCPECPVLKAEGFTRFYYCTRASETGLH